MILNFNIFNKYNKNDSLDVEFDLEWESIVFYDGLNWSEGFVRDLNCSNLLKEVISNIEDIGDVLMSSTTEDYVEVENTDFVVVFDINKFMIELEETELLPYWNAIVAQYSFNEAIRVTDFDEYEIRTQGEAYLE